MCYASWQVQIVFVIIKVDTDYRQPPLVTQQRRRSTPAQGARAAAPKLNVGRNVPIRFHPPIFVFLQFLLDLEALLKQFHLVNLNLPCFSKKINKRES